MPATRTIDFSRPIALFPLPNCVLLPHTTIPLHIFERRYRKMVNDALDARGLIALALFEGESWKQEYDGAPPLRPYVCIGYITRHLRLADGRFNLLLQGICRARIKKEVPHPAYRAAVLEPAEPSPTMEIDLVDVRRRIESLLADPLLRQLSSVCAIQNYVSEEIPTSTLIDMAAMTCSGTVDERYEILSECDALTRGQWLERLLRNLRQTLEMADRFKPGETPDQLHVN